MDKVFRVNSNQSENLSSVNNLLDFRIEAGQVYDLTKSYVSVRAKATGTNADDVASTVHNVDLAFNTKNDGAAENTNYVPSVALVKNARMNSQRMGRIEELRDVNKLRLYQQQVMKDEEDVLKNAAFNFQSLRDKEPYGFLSPLINPTAEDQSGNPSGVATTAIEKEVRIPVGDILNCGNLQYFDTRRLGGCELSLEMDIDRVSANADAFDSDYYITSNGGQVDDDNDPGEKTVITLTKVYNDDYQSKIGFYVGMPIRNGADAPGGVGTIATVALPVNTRRTITDITFDSSTGKVSLTLSASLGAGALADLKIRPVATADITTSFTMGSGQLVLYALGNDKLDAVPDKVEFTKYNLERDNGNGLQKLHKNYTVEPEAMNMVVLFPAHVNEKLSNLDVTSHRVAVDNNNLTNRAIHKNTPLYYNRLERYHLNAGSDVVNILQKQFDEKIKQNNFSIYNMSI